MDFTLAQRSDFFQPFKEFGEEDCNRSQPLLSINHRKDIFVLRSLEQEVAKITLAQRLLKVFLQIGHENLHLKFSILLTSIPRIRTLIVWDNDFTRRKQFLDCC